MRDDIDAYAFAPHLKLFDGRRAKCIARGKNDAFVLRAEIGGEFADAGRFARAVDADHENDVRFRFEHAVTWRGLSRFFQHLDQFIFQDAFHFFRTDDALGIRARAQIVHDLHRHLSAEVCLNQRVFKPGPKFGRNLIVQPNEILQFGLERFAGFGQSLFGFFFVALEKIKQLYFSI